MRVSPRFHVFAIAALGAAVAVHASGWLLREWPLISILFITALLFTCNAVIVWCIGRLGWRSLLWVVLISAAEICAEVAAAMSYYLVKEFVHRNEFMGWSAAGVAYVIMFGVLLLAIWKGGLAREARRTQGA